LLTLNVKKNPHPREIRGTVNYLRLQLASKPVPTPPPYNKLSSDSHSPSKFLLYFFYFFAPKYLTDTSTHDYYCVKYTQENSNVETYVEKV
jgi:hypothetical protein